MHCKEFEFNLSWNDKRQGIVHIIGPEQGFTQPGTIIVCGDSHSATHGADISFWDRNIRGGMMFWQHKL